MNNLPAQQPPSYNDAILRAASDPTIDVDKMQRLLDMVEADKIRQREQAFMQAHADAEAEMGTITADANNPQTRSRYATFARLDRAVRPVYTKHGLAVSFSTEPMSTPDSLLVVGTLSHRQGHSKRYQLPVPISTKGIKGTDMMTPIHATMSAVSYGKRNLEIMMFNLQVGDDDDDGNRAGGPRNPPPMSTQQRDTTQQQPKITELINPETGEVLSAPAAIVLQGNDYKLFGQQFVWALNNLAPSIDIADEWILKNNDTVEAMQRDRPLMFKNLLDAIAVRKDQLLQH